MSQEKTRREFNILIDKDEARYLKDAINTRRRDTDWAKNELLVTHESMPDEDGYYAELKVWAPYDHDDTPYLELIIWDNDEELFADGDIELDDVGTPGRTTVFSYDDDEHIIVRLIVDQNNQMEVSA